jgi:hypothetical protein
MGKLVILTLHIRPHRLRQTNHMRINPLRILGHIRDSMQDMEVEPQKITNFFEQSNHLRVEIHRKLETTAAQPDNLKQPAVNPHIATIDIMQPHIVDRPRVEFFCGRRYFRTVIFDLRHRVPSPSQNILHSLHVRSCRSICRAQIMAPVIGGRSHICDMWQASEKRYCVLNYGRMRFGFWVAEMVTDLIMQIFYIGRAPAGTSVLVLAFNFSSSRS